MWLWPQCRSTQTLLLRPLILSLFSKGRFGFVKNLGCSLFFVTLIICWWLLNVCRQAVCWKVLKRISGLFWGLGLSICYGLLSSCIGFLFLSLCGYWIHDLHLPFVKGGYLEKLDVESLCEYKCLCWGFF